LELPPRLLAAWGGGVGRFLLVLVGMEAEFLTPADAAVGIEPFEDEFGRGSANGIGSAVACAERGVRDIKVEDQAARARDSQ
jgi:hypothetical protein